MTGVLIVKTTNQLSSNCSGEFGDGDNDSIEFTGLRNERLTKRIFRAVTRTNVVFAPFQAERMQPFAKW